MRTSCHNYKLSVKRFSLKRITERERLHKQKVKTNMTDMNENLKVYKKSFKKKILYYVIDYKT